MPEPSKFSWYVAPGGTIAQPPDLAPAPLNCQLNEEINIPFTKILRLGPLLAGDPVADTIIG